MPGIPFTKNDPRINREGRPEGTKNFTTKVKEALMKIADGKDYTYEEAFVKSILKNAIVDGKEQTQKLIWNYLDGMPVNNTDITSGGMPITSLIGNPKEVKKYQAIKDKYEAELLESYARGKTNTKPN